MRRIIPSLSVGRGGALTERIEVGRFPVSDDPEKVAAAYAESGADGVLLVADGVGLETLVTAAARVASLIPIPVTVAADLSNQAEVGALLDAGVARVAIQDSALHDPDYIAQLTRTLGPNAIAVAIAAKREELGWRVVEGRGGAPTEWDPVTWAAVVRSQGCGEVMVYSGSGGIEAEPFDLELLESITSAVDVNVVAAGKATCVEDVFDVLMIGNVDAVVLGSLLHSGQHSLREVKLFLAEHGLDVQVDQ